jgi:uncharacterized membrane protein
MGLSNLGIFHTIIGITALAAAIISFVRYGKINLAHLTGKLYFYATIITAVTALGISKSGGFNKGHVFSLFILAIILVAHLLFTKRKQKKRARYVENFLLSFSFFLSLIPTINETFTRIPTSHPLAEGPTDPLIGKTLLTLFIVFCIGAIFQFIKQRKINKLQ